MKPTRTEYFRPARIQGDSVKEKNMSAGSSKTFNCQAKGKVPFSTEKDCRCTSIKTDPFWLSPLQYCAGWVKLFDQSGWYNEGQHLLIRAETRQTHVDSPSKGSDACSDDRILVNCDNFLIHENFQRFLARHGKLNIRRLLAKDTKKTTSSPCTSVDCPNPYDTREKWDIISYKKKHKQSIEATS